MAEFRQTSSPKVVRHQILCGKLVSQASFGLRSPKFGRLKPGGFRIFLMLMKWRYFGLVSSNEACDTNFPHRIWCLTTFGEEVWQNSAIGRFWRFFVAILAIFYPSPGYFFGWLGNFDSAYTEVLIGINSFADTTPGVVKLFRVSVS